MDDKEIRLKIIESLIAAAPRADLRAIEDIVERAKELEKYIKGTSRPVRKPAK